MKATELRIGNYIDYTTEREIVTMQITYEYIRLIHNGNKNFKLIPLTEEWLLKFGFYKDVEFDNTFNLPFNVLNGFTTISIDVRANVILLDNLELTIQYVHQLQNLYFALTNEELTLIK
jgi:hypothetical protein